LFWQKIIVFHEIISPQPIIPADKILNSFTGSNIYLLAFAKVLLLLICSYAFIIILSVHNVLPNRKYLAVVLFLSVVSVFIDGQNIVNNLFALFFHLFAFYNLFSTYRSDNVKSHVFIAAFLTGISIMFSFPFVVAIINLLTALLIFGIITRRTIISVILGLITPFVFLLYFFRLAYHDVSSMLHAIKNNFDNLFFITFDFDDFTPFFMGFVFLVTCFSILKISNSKHTKSVQKMTDQIFYFTVITSAFITIFVSGLKPYGIMFFGISAAYLITRFSQLVRRERIAEIIVFMILIAAIVYNNYTLLF
jgi:hypothetical protein